VVLKPASPPGLLLDIDGTLVDSAYFHTLAWQRSLTASGFAVPAFRVHRLIGMGGDQFVEALLGKAAEREHGDALRDGWEREYEPLLPEVRPLPGAAALIERAEEEGWRVVFASSSPGEHLERYLELLGAEHLRDRATTSEDVEATKPAPDLIEVALGRAGTRRALLVGDATHDVRAAANAGIATACVLTGGYSEAELREAGAVDVYPTAAELGDRLGELERMLAA
jgi:phosphoglycolate phosphatase-like HAD superfamily hydrolase